MKISNRNKVWRRIWDQKYKNCQQKIPPHVMAGYDCIDENQFCIMVQKFISYLDLKQEHNILDVGCGCGAFCKHIKSFKTITGIDYSQDAIQKISGLLDGNFYIAESAYIPFKSSCFDRVISFGTFIYFSSVDYVMLTLNEMERVTRPGGIMFIGELNDLDKKTDYIRLRQESNHGNNQIMKNVYVDHQFFQKDLFTDFARFKNLKIEIIDESQLDIPFYINANYRFSVIMRKN